MVGMAAETSRRGALKLARVDECFSCGKPLSPDSEGDHIVPVGRGGSHGIDNYLPACGPCNSSKGQRDLLEWWRGKNRRAVELPANAITAYCRQMFARLRTERLLVKEAPEAVRATVGELYDLLPSDEHRSAWWQKVNWTVGGLP